MVESVDTASSLKQILYRAVSLLKAAEHPVSEVSEVSESAGSGGATPEGKPVGNDKLALEDLKIVDTAVMEPGRPGLLDVIARHGEVLYHVVVGLRVPADEARFFADCDNPVLGLYEDGEGLAVAVDALEDQEMVARLTRCILSGSDRHAARQLPQELTGTIRKEPGDGDTAVYVIGETVMLTIMRSLAAGANPGMEMLVALDSSGFNNMFAPISTWKRGGYELGIVQEYMPGTSSGWDVALTSLRDLCSAQCAPQDAGADFASDAFKIGETLARMHLALDKAFGRSKMDMAGYLDSLDSLDSLDGVNGLDTLEASEGGRVGIYPAMGLLDQSDVPFYQVRLHGSFNLNNIRRGEYGWYLGRMVQGASGRAPLFFSPLYDLATVLLSLHDVAQAALAERDPLSAGEVGKLIEAWENRNSEVLTKGYLNVGGIVGIVPPQAEYFDALLQVMKQSCLQPRSPAL
ncbi:MAG: hypothetical protein ACYDGY_07470 [Acidimicrobiales bacterium]